MSIADQIRNARGGRSRVSELLKPSLSAQVEARRLKQRQEKMQVASDLYKSRVAEGKRLAEKANKYDNISGMKNTEKIINEFSNGGVANTIRSGQKKLGGAIEKSVVGVTDEMMRGHEPKKDWSQMSFLSKSEAIRKEAMDLVMPNKLAETGSQIIGAAGGIMKYQSRTMPNHYINDAIHGDKNNDEVAADYLMNIQNRFSKRYEKELTPQTYNDDDTIFNKPSLIKNWEYVGNVLAGQLPHLILGVASGGIYTVGIEGGGAMQDRFTKAEKEGRDVNLKDVLYTTVVGTINGALERMGINAIFGKNKFIKDAVNKRIKNAVAKYVVKVGATIAFEDLTEYLQETVPVLAGKVIFDEGGTFKEVIALANKGGLQAASQATIAAGLSSVVTTTPSGNIIGDNQRLEISRQESFEGTQKQYEGIDINKNGKLDSKLVEGRISDMSQKISKQEGAVKAKQFSDKMNEGTFDSYEDMTEISKKIMSELKIKDANIEIKIKQEAEREAAIKHVEDSKTKFRTSDEVVKESVDTLAAGVNEQDVEIMQDFATTIDENRQDPLTRRQGIMLEKELGLELDTEKDISDVFKAIISTYKKNKEAAIKTEINQAEKDLGKTKEKPRYSEMKEKEVKLKDSIKGGKEVEAKDLSKLAENSFENTSANLKQQTNREVIKKQIISGDYKAVNVRILDNGKLFIEDGRNRVAVAASMGVRVKTNNVTKFYKPKKAKSAGFRYKRDEKGRYAGREKFRTKIAESSTKDGTEVAKEAKKLGSDQGGLSDYTLNQIKEEDYKTEKVSIKELRKSDKDLDDYLKTNKPKVREFKGEAFGMNPIVSSSGEVIDGYNRIAQTIESGEKSIAILRGIKKGTEKFRTKIAESSLSDDISKAKSEGKSFDRTVNNNIKDAKTGEPIIVKGYHGTADGRFLEEFDPTKKGYFKDAPELLPDNKEFKGLYGDIGKGFSSDTGVYKGISFTDDYNVAKSYTEKPAYDYQNSVPMVVERNIVLKNPKVINATGKKQWEIKLEDVVSQAKKEGYDGVVFKGIKDNYHPDTTILPSNNIVIFNKNQIKTKSQLKQLWDKKGTEKFRLKDLFKKKDIDITNKQEQELIDIHKKMLGDDNIKITAQIVTNPNALGSHKAGMIKILKGQADPEATLYHEAVHKYLDVFTTKEEMVDILIAAKKTFKIKGNDFAAVEEKLAESFIEYARSKSGIKGTLSVYYDTIIERINKYFKNEDAVKKLYADIFTGKARKIKRKGVAKAKIKRKGVIRAQLPVGSGRVKLSRLEARVKDSLDEAPEEVKDLSTYSIMSKKENIAKAVKYIDENPDNVLKILAGEMEAPDGILKNSIYVAVINDPNMDIEMATKLASAQSTRLGQEISILSEINPDSAMKHLNDIVNERVRLFEKKHKKDISKAKNEVVKEINQKVKSAMPTKSDWSAFVEEITC